MTNHPNRKRVTVEVGKAYLTRDGQRIAIEAETTRAGTYKMQGVDSQGRVTWRSRRGAFTSHPHRLDLITEA